MKLTFDGLIFLGAKHRSFTGDKGNTVNLYEGKVAAEGDVFDVKLSEDLYGKLESVSNEKGTAELNLTSSAYKGKSSLRLELLSFDAE